MGIKYFRPSEITPYYNNPRKNDAAVVKIAESIKSFGFRNPILLDKDKTIIAGHTRWKAALLLKLETVPCIIYDDMPEDKVKAYRIADNRMGEFAEWDWEQLNIEMEDFDDELKELLDFEIPEMESISSGLIDDDEIPEVEEPICKPGDLWKLGEHRLLCGDATNSDDVERLMAGNKADMVFTDPPYNVDYEGYTKDKLTIKSDAMSAKDYKQFLLDIFKGIKIAIKDGAGLYVCHADAWQLETEQALNDCGFEMRNQIIWAKNTFAWGFGRYKFQHEPIFYAHVKGKSDAWYGDKSQSTLWMENKPSANKLHPTMKPVEIVLRATNNSSKEGDIVVDLFLGSGSTLIACEKTNRKCYGMEIDPHYCDVVIKRWEDFTGKKAELING